jgi:polyhydroxybutyrate depolymerase
VLPDRVDDGTTAVVRTYGNGKDGSEVVLIEIRGGGHTWPGREFGPELAAAGNSSQDVSSNELIWAFFAKHPMN